MTCRPLIVLCTTTGVNPPSIPTFCCPGTRLLLPIGSLPFFGKCIVILLALCCSNNTILSFLAWAFSVSFLAFSSCAVWCAMVYCRIAILCWACFCLHTAAVYAFLLAIVSFFDVQLLPFVLDRTWLLSVVSGSKIGL
jgi:hypothetical protein